MMRWPGTLRRVAWACLKKDLRSVRTERAFLFQTIILPLNYHLLLILFALSGSNAPTAVVMRDQGPYAQQLYRPWRRPIRSLCKPLRQSRHRR